MKVAQKKGLQYYQTRSNAIILYDTLPAICIKKVVYMKSGEELSNKVYQSPRLPQRAVLKPNMPHDVRILPISKREHPSTIKAKKAKSTAKPVTIAIATEEPKSSGKPEAVHIELRIQGIPHSIIQKQDGRADEEF